MARSKIALAMAAYGPIEHQTVASYVNMFAYALEHSKHEFLPVWAFKTFICGARESLVKMAIKNECDYIIFLDADMLWPGNLLTSLVDFANNNKEVHVVSGNYSMRNPPHMPLVYLDDGQGKYQPSLLKEEDWGKCVQCDATGLGACLLRTSLFESVSSPWFSLEGTGTEDIFFFKKANKEVEDFNLTVMTSLNCGHISVPSVVYPTTKLPHDENTAFGSIISSEDFCREHFDTAERKCQAAQ